MKNKEKKPMEIIGYVVATALILALLAIVLAGLWRVFRWVAGF